MLPRNFKEFWTSTTLIVRSSFPPKARTEERPLFLQNCTDHLYNFQRKFAGPSTFELHDGPPYANGSLHAGHALNKILKDIVCRYHVSKGTKVRYVPGWDCHGLPIELKALQVDAKHPRNAVETRAAARELALAAIKEQKQTFRKWAIMADWKNAWTTMDPGFEIKQLEAFQTMVTNGLIHRRNKPIYWSPSTRTALAEAELEYREDHASQAAYVAFSITHVPAPSAKRRRLDWSSVKALVWTTTPWTIPANQAIAVNPDITYLITEIENHGFVLTTKSMALGNGNGLARKIGQNTKSRNFEFQGSELVGATYRHPLHPETSPPLPILAADFVTEGMGTGLVHCAPGHGMDDYKLGQAHGLATFAPVDDDGCFTEQASPNEPAVLQGKAVLKEGNEAVLTMLADAKALIHASPYTHKYPYDWRSKQPVIQRATLQWFADLTSIQQAAVSAMDRVQFIPRGGKERLLSFVQNRAEWCISRQRAWGVPIPALYHRDTGTAVLTEASIAHIIETIKSRGIDAWWTDREDDPAWTPPTLLDRDGKTHFRRGSDTMDVWFDSGTTWTQIEGGHQTNGHPVADVYLEGSDQHRGWFQSSLLTFVAQSLRETNAGMPSAPFKTLITHGFTLDDKGRKMSKSEGNVVTPQEIMDASSRKRHPKRGSSKLGDFDKPGDVDKPGGFDDQDADALRLWVATSDYTKDVTINYEALGNNCRLMEKLRVTLKLLITLQRDSDPCRPIVFGELSLVDRIALLHLRKFDEDVRCHYENYEFHKAIAAINNYVRTQFSSFYVESIKDRMYLDGLRSSSRLQGLAVLWEIFQRLLHRLSPMLPVLCEEASHYMTLDTGRDCAPLPWREADLQSHMATWESKELQDDMAVLFEAKSTVNALQEEYGRKLHKMGSSLQSYLAIELGDSSSSVSLFHRYTKEELEAFFVVSKVCIDSGPHPDADWQTSAPVQVSVHGTLYEFIVHVFAPSNQKCARCWRYVVSEEAAEELESPVCQRCLGAWNQKNYKQSHLDWLQANAPRVQMATVSLQKRGEEELDAAWKTFHWDVAYGKS